MAGRIDLRDPPQARGKAAGRLPAPIVAGLALLVAAGGLVFWLWWQDLRHPLAPAPHGAVTQIIREAPVPAPAEVSKPPAVATTPPASAPPPSLPQPPKPSAAASKPPPVPQAPAETKTPPAAPAASSPTGAVQEPKPGPPPSKPAPETAKPQAPAEAAKPEPPAPPPTQMANAPTSPPIAAPPPKPEAAKPLAPVPDPALIAKTPRGPLPIIAPDGRQAWQVYARPFEDLRKRPRIAVVLGDMGLSQSATTTAIQQLPAAVTLAFAPYASDLQSWIAKARAAGHEVMLQLPMEPLDYPANDPGPQALLTSLTRSDNLERLDWLLSRFTGYIGVTNYMGSKFTASPADLRPVLEEIKRRGLMFLDSRSSQRSVVPKLAREIGLPHAVNSRFLDNEASRAAIDARLEEVERIARSTGTAVGMGYPYPVTIERIARWAAQLPAKDLVLAPVSAVANRQNIE